MTDATLATFAELVAITPDALQPVAHRLRELIEDADPDTVEVVRLGDRAATYGVGPRKMREGYAYLMPHARWINLGFYHGATLPDPSRLLEGSGTRMRHVKIRSLEDTENPAVRVLISAAVRERHGATEP